MGNKCRNCEKNIISKRFMMVDGKEYNIVMESGETTHGSKDYVWYMGRYNDVVGVCEVLKCTGMEDVQM